MPVYNKIKTNMAVRVLKNSVISTVKASESLSVSNIESRGIFKDLITQFAYLIVSVFISRGTVLGVYAPFGPSFIAAVPYKNLWASVSGTVIGYILPMNVNGSMRYISTVLAIAAVRWTLSDLSKFNSYPIYVPVIALVPTLATGLAMNTVDGITFSLILLSFIESLICAAVAYFFNNSFSVFSNYKSLNSLSQTEFTCLFMTCCVFMLSFSSLSVGFFSVGRVLAIVSILLCSRFAGVAGGVISGTSAGIVLSLSSPSLSYLAGAYAFGGLMSGLFSSFGKIAVAVAFIVSNAALSLQTGDVCAVITGLYEVLLSTVIFMLVPKKILNFVSKIFYEPYDSEKLEGLRRSVIIRLNFIGKSLCNVADSVDAVSEKLEKLNTPNSSSVYENAVDKVCNRCGMRAFCWDKEKEKTIKVFYDANQKLLEKQCIKSDEFAEEFIRRCCKVGEVTSAMNKSYDEFQMNEVARRRVNEIRCVVSEQFAGMGEILSDMAKEFDTYEYFDVHSSKKVNEKLKDCGLIPIDSVCRIDKFGRMCVEVEAAYADKKIVDEIDLPKIFGDSLSRSFDVPNVIMAPDRCRIQISEKPVYEVNIGSSQHICNNGTLCGDSYSYFNDGSGRVVVILSDGMGTGGRAAVDGAMASDIMSRLSKAGLNFESALKIVNSALFIKSSDESLATIDLVCIDLFTGKVDLMKAGAPFTLVKSNQKVIRFDESSLPAGILTDVKFVRNETYINSGDWILMISDGALALGEDFLEDELKKCTYEDPQMFATYIVDQIVKKRDDGYDDDITAVAIRLSRL